MFENMQGTLNGMFGKIQPGMCRLTVNGNIAVKTNNGFKTYDVKSKKLTNVTNFCFNIGGDEMFAFFFGVYDLDKIMADVDERLKRATKELGYTVSASMGTYTTFFDKDLDLTKALDIADEHMYENKRRYKERTSNA
jgi:GGDEF domain-containing protein